MKRYPDHLVRQARRLVVSSQLNYVQVASQLGVSDSLISVWCRGLSNQKIAKTIATLESRRKDLVNSEKLSLDEIAISKALIKLCCSIIYGCEGSKYPASNHVSVANSDPRLIEVFVNLLRQSFDLKETKWKVLLQIHSDQNYEKLKSYWSQLLQISKDQFYKPTVTKARGRKHRNGYMGTCTVRYCDYRIQLKLMGIFDEFLNLHKIPNNRVDMIIDKK